MSGLTKTYLLIAALTAFFGFIGAMIGGQQGMITAFVIAFVMNIFAYWNSDKVVLKIYKAQPLERNDFPRIYKIIETLAANAGMPMPKPYIIDNPQPNAFATGRNPENGAIALTTGIMNILSEEELGGVIAHELAHIKNRDTLIMTVTATIAGAISMLANFAMFFGHSRSGERNGNALVMIMVSILAPVAAMLVQMCISRTREYQADRVGAEISGNPGALAAALQKISGHAKNISNHEAENNPATAHMFIISPLHGRSVDNLFSTHPKTENRIAELMKLSTTPNMRKGTFPEIKKGTFSYR